MVALELFLIFRSIVRAVAASNIVVVTSVSVEWMVVYASVVLDKRAGVVPDDLDDLPCVSSIVYQGSMTRYLLRQFSREM